MERVRAHIKIRQAELAEHPFFRRLSQSTAVRETMAFVAAPTFFVMAFQDILRLNATQIRDPALLEIAECALKAVGERVEHGGRSVLAPLRSSG